MTMRNVTVLASTIALTVAMTPAVFSQGLLIEPDTLDFGIVQVGLTGQPEDYHTFTVTNQTGSDQVIRIDTENIPEPESVRIFRPLTASVHPILRRIYDAVGCYRQDFDDDAYNVTELMESGYLEIEEEYLREWEFFLIGHAPITQIEARGIDLSALLDCQTTKISTLSQDPGAREPINEFTLRSGETETFTVSFMPWNEVQFSGFIDFSYGEEQARMHVSGASEFRFSVALSRHGFNFGDVEAGRRATERLTITNTSGLLSRINFELTNPQAFYAYREEIAPTHDFVLMISEAIERFHQTRGEDPNSVEDLIAEGYIEIPEILDREWTFSLLGRDPVGMIEGVTTSENPGGAGYVFLYDRDADRFTGRGIINDAYDSHSILLGRDRSAVLIVAFNSIDDGDHYGTLRIRSYNSHRHDVYQGYDIWLDGHGLTVPSGGEFVTPGSLHLNPSYPNPFNSSTVIRVDLPANGDISFTVYDAQGRQVSSAGFPNRQAGYFNWVWNGRNDAGTPMASGVYICKTLYAANSGSQEASVKMTLIR